MRGNVRGKRIGPYVLEGCLGEGGMGIVYLATHAVDEDERTRVALKVLRDVSPSQTMLARFETEKAMLMRLEHPNIARILDAGVDEHGQPWFTMEFVDGLPITEYCNARDLKRSERLALFEGVCRGVQHAHQKGVLHRDLKPQNVLVTTIDGRAHPKLIDFGIARALDDEAATGLTAKHGCIVGTPQYMSPEQLGGSGAVDTRSDVYGLGALLYELLANEPPFRREDFDGRGLSEVRRMVREVVPVPPMVRRNGTLPRTTGTDVGEETRRTLGSPSDFDTTVNLSMERSNSRPSNLRAKEDLDWMTLKALAKEPDQRYPSVGALLLDLERLQRHLPVGASPPTRSYRLRKFLRRRQFEVGVTAILLAILIIGFVLTWSAMNTSRAAERAETVARIDELGTSDALRAAFVIERARAPWPTESTLEANLRWVADWLDEADEILSRESLHREALHDAAQAATHASRTRLLESFPVLRRLRIEVASRASVLRNTWPLWERCEASLRAVEGFESLELPPLPHLIPLGIELDHDREHGRPIDPLWIFAVGGTGALPIRVDTRNEPVPWGEPGFTRFEDDSAILLVLVPGGTFYRGAQNKDPDAPGYDPRWTTNWGHEVPIDLVTVDPFLVSRYEVTQAQFTRFLDAVGRTRADLFVLEGQAREPVRGVDWRDAMLFCRWAGLTLPSESQWEYACRAGTTGSCWNGDSLGELAEVSWFVENSNRRPRPVDSWPSTKSPANPWGLLHVLGNVEEWTLDSFFRTHEGAPLDGSARIYGGNSNRARRGGSVELTAEHLRSARRRKVHEQLFPFAGFRPILPLR